MRADEELEAEVAKADIPRHVHQDATKKRKAAFNEDSDTGAGVGFGTYSSSTSGAAPLDSATAPASEAAGFLHSCPFLHVVLSDVLEKGPMQ